MKTFTIGDFDLKVADDLRLKKSIFRKFKLGTDVTVASLGFDNLDELYDLDEGCETIFEEDGKLYLDISLEDDIEGDEILLETFINQPMINAHLSFLSGTISLLAESELRCYGDDIFARADEDGFIVLDNEIVLYGLNNVGDKYYIYEYKVL